MSKTKIKIGIEPFKNKLEFRIQEEDKFLPLIAFTLEQERMMAIISHLLELSKEGREGLVGLTFISNQAEKS